MPSDEPNLKVLLALLRDLSQPSRSRAEAAETIGYDFQFDRGPNREPIILALRTALNDPHADVRFWSLYALGTMRAIETRAEVEALLNDDAVWCPGWWTVGDEARNVLAVFDGHPWPKREVRGVMAP
jgi:hypothetical protein